MDWLWAAYNSLLYSVQIGSGDHPACCQRGTMGPFPGIELQGRHADHSNLYSVQVENGGVISPLLHHHFMAQCLVI
jgi:hypothetical protein